MTASISDTYLTISEPLRAPEHKVKGSKFIADLLPVSTKEETEAQLRVIRKEFYDATHHCFAYRLGPTGALLRAADDGEPAGTAGKPILLVLTSARLTDVLLVVTRYYGGTRLGTGGLARAYAESAQQAVSMASLKQVFLTDAIKLVSPYDEFAALQRTLGQYGAVIVESTYLDSVQLTISLRRSLVEKFQTEVREAFHGRIWIG